MEDITDVMDFSFSTWNLQEGGWKENNLKKQTFILFLSRGRRDRDSTFSFPILSDPRSLVWAPSYLVLTMTRDRELGRSSHSPPLPRPWSGEVDGRSFPSSWFLALSQPLCALLACLLSGPFTVCPLLSLPKLPL